MQMSFWEQTRSDLAFLGGQYYEMIERLAYYGVRVVIPIYIAQADEIGGLHFSQADKGFISCGGPWCNQPCQYLPVALLTVTVISIKLSRLLF